MGDENTDLKRAVNRYIARLFNNKDRNSTNLAYAYYRIDDLLSFIEREQSKIGTALLETDFREEFFKEENIKVYFDEECGILIDTINEQEQFDLLMKQNKKVLERDVLGQLKE